MKAAIIGTSGYTGLLLLRILAKHPEITDIIPVSSSKAGEDIRTIEPGLHDSILKKMKLTNGLTVSIEQAQKFSIDVVFAALPHLKSAELCAPFFDSSVVIDLSADFRTKDVDLFAKAYGVPPPRPDLLQKAVYGLCEWNHEALKTAQLIANPGCYPTAALVPLLPLIKEDAIFHDRVIINAISGISGAGKKLADNYLFCERIENTGAYSPGRTHRHAMEIENQLAYINPSTHIYFTPHLAPLKRGMSITTYTELKKPLTKEEVTSLYNKYYGNSIFIRLKNSIPQSRDVWGSNRCDFSFHIEDNKLFLISVIDNLVKGACGQAVQAMNIRFGFKEDAGLDLDNQL